MWHNHSDTKLKHHINTSMNYLRKTIGWYLLGICALGIWAGWETGEGWIMLLVVPVVLWKTPPFNWSNQVFGWAASKDPLGTKRATKKFLTGKKWYWWVGYTLLVWLIVSVLVSLISGEATLVLIG